MTFSMDRTALALGRCSRTFSGSGSSCSEICSRLSRKWGGIEGRVGDEVGRGEENETGGGLNRLRWKEEE